MQATWQDMAIDDSARPLPSVRIYEGAARLKSPPLVLYLGGGAFQQAPLPATESPVARALADRGAVVVEADYGGEVRNTFPQAMEYVFKVLSCLSNRRKLFGSAKSSLFVAGQEAGGNIAAGVALKARDQIPGQLAGQLLLSPMIDPLMTSGSFRKAGEIGMLHRWSQGWSHYLRSACGFSHPYAAPCLCSRLAGVAPALVMTAEDDPLKDEALSYAKRMAEAGVKVEQRILPAGQGWTDMYRGEGGAWIDVVCDEFAAFTSKLKH